MLLNRRCVFDVAASCETARRLYREGLFADKILRTSPVAADESARDSRIEQGQSKVKAVHNESGFKGDGGRREQTLH